MQVPKVEISDSEMRRPWVSWPGVFRKVMLMMEEIRRSPAGMYKTLQIMVDKLPTSTGDRRISEPSTVLLQNSGEH